MFIRHPNYLKVAQKKISTRLHQGEILRDPAGNDWSSIEAAPGAEPYSAAVLFLPWSLLHTVVLLYCSMKAMFICTVHRNSQKI